MLFKALSVVLLASGCSGQTFTLKRTYDAGNFFDGFDFRDAAYYDEIDPSYGGDPSHGSVNYLNQTAAEAAGLIYTEAGQVYILADYTHIAQPLGRGTDRHGRDSVRLESKESYSSGLLIADIVHMPGTACGVWPSFWSYNFDEDPIGEIDVIEGTNNADSNIVSLHTCGTCSFSNIGGLVQRPQCDLGYGDPKHDCEKKPKNVDGCGNTLSTGSYGDAFNDSEGGVYAVWLNSNTLNIYWWSRKNIPSDITAGKPNPSTWGTPASHFAGGNNCDVSNYFKKQTIIINTDFCGEDISQDDWDATCGPETGTATCDEYVTNNPSDFAGAYWVFNSIKLYQ